SASTWNANGQAECRIMGKLRRMLRADLESEAGERAFGTGWVSGVLGPGRGVFRPISGPVLLVPGGLRRPLIRGQCEPPWFRIALHFILIAAFVLAVLNIILRRQKIMGLVAMTAVLAATLLGGSHVESSGALATGYYLGLDWFLINLTLLGILFIPLERL